MIVKLSKWVVRHTNIIIIVALALLVPSLVGFVLTPVNYDILSILPNQDEPGDIEDSNAIYGIDIIDEVFQSSSISVVIMEDLSPKEMDRICEDVNEVKGVSQAMWVGSVADIGIPESMYPDALKDMLYSVKDGHKSTLMLVQYEPDDPDERDYDSIAKVRAVKEVLDSEHCFVYGLSAVMDDTKAIIESEMFLYIAVAIVLATLIIFVTTKQWLMPLVVIATLGCGVAYNMGTNFILGDISYITQAIAAILQMAVTIDYSIILLDRFEEESAKTTNVKKAMAKAVSYSFTSLIGGASTTFFGFIALCFMSLTLGLDIGIVMAKGIIFGLLSVLIIMPALILKFYKYIFKYEHKRLNIKFDRPIDFVIKHKKAMTAVFILLFIPMYLLKSNVSTYTDLNNKMPETCDSWIATDKLTNDYDIASIHFAVINDEIPTGEVSQLIKDMEQVDGVTSVIGLNSFVGAGIPADILPDSITSICEKGGYRLIALFSAYDLSHKDTQGNSLMSAQKKELTSIVKQYDKNGCITGENILYDELVDIADRDFNVTSIISICAVLLLIALTFKSILIPIILVAGVELAIFINIAVSTVTGSEICFLTPIVLGCVQLGATIDYAILLTSRFREELRSGKEKHEAMSVAAKLASKSIFQSALTFFCATIGIVFVCKIELVTGICVLLARGALISAAVIICLVTPVLVCCEGAINKTTFGWRKPSDFNNKRGLGSMKKNKKVAKSVLSVFICLCMALSFAGCGKKEPEQEDKQQNLNVLYENTARNVTKNETVYVNMNAKGQITKTTVTDWIHTDSPEVRVYDKTTLDSSKIQNVKGDSTPIVNENNPNELMWNLSSTDLYYTADTTQAPPVTMNIKYYLDGQEMSAEDIAGKSGTVTVEFEFTNSYAKAVKVNGVSKKMYLPMVVIGGTILPEDHFSAIETKNGMSVGDGTNEIAVVYSLPGVGQSLGIGKEDLQGYGDIELNNKASITATTDCFELSNMYFAAIPIASLDLKFDASGQVDSLQGTLSILKTLFGSLKNVDIKGLMNAISSNSDDISSLTSVLNDAIYVYESNQAALQKLSSALTTENITALKDLLTELNKPENQTAIAALTNSSFLQSITNLQDLAAALEKAQPVLNQLSDVMNDPEVQATLDNLDSTMATLDKLQKEIDKNKNLINLLTDVLSDSNLDAISDISTLLSESNVDLADYGIIVDDTDAFIADCEAWFNIGKDYKIFTDAHSSMKTNVAFIYMTESITHNYTSTEPVEQAQEETTKVSWFKKLFG